MNGRKKPSHVAHAAHGYDAVCHGKQQHDRATATKIARKMKDGDRISTYLCPFCGHWHLGEKKKGPRP